MRKFTFSFKSLLLAAGLLLGSANAWAGTKVLYSQDYESAIDASSWTSANNAGGLSLQTGDATYGKYIQFYGNGLGGGRTAYTNFYSTDFYSDYAAYTIEFDAAVRCSNYASHYTELVVASDGYSLVGNDYFTNKNTTNKNYLFLLKSKGEAANSTKYYINGGSTEYSIAANAWFHVKLEVNVSDKTIDYTLTGAVSATGTYTITDASSIKAKALVGTVGRGTYGTVRIDNISITTETDEEVVSTPTIAVAYNGANRTVTITSGTSSESNPVTTYYTTDGSTPTSSSNVYSSALDISSNCTVKAITISNKATSSDIASEEVTVGKLTLNAPTFTKTGFSAGSYTYTIAADQSSLAFVPASTTIKYRVGSTGDFATYTSAISVPAGDILYAYTEADKYTTSSTSEVCAVALPAMTKAFGQNYVGVVNADLWMAVSAGPTVTNAKSTSDANYFIPSNDGGTSALTNENISFYFYKDGSDSSKDKKWGLKTTGMYADYTRGYADVKINNLTVGQIVEVSASAINSVTGLTELTTYSYGKTHYYVTTATTAYLNIERQKYVYSINVYNLDNEIVGAMDYTTPYYNQWNTTPIWINAGETAYYKFKNYNNGGNLLHQNWCLFGATEASENVVIFGPNHSNTGGAYTSKPTFTNADLNGATVELTTTLTDAGNGTYTLTTTGITTKADGTTTLSPNLVYQQTGLTASKLKLYVSVDNSWLALIQQAQVATISEAGYATFSSSNNAFDLTTANTPAGLTAYYIEGDKLTKDNAPFTTIDQTVAAGQGILLKGDAGTYNIKVAASGDALEDNALVATNGSAITAGNYVFAYETDNPSTTAGFYYVSVNTAPVATGKAYLDGSLVPTNVKAFIFDGTTTGIETAPAAEAEEDGVYYNTAGQVVTKDYKGIVIKNGKKYFNK